MRGPMDTSNIAQEFTAEPAAVTPSPAQSRLREVVKEATGGDTPPSFKEFTFTHSSVLDGQTYRVSFAGEWAACQDARFGLPAQLPSTPQSPPDFHAPCLPRYLAEDEEHELTLHDMPANTTAKNNNITPVTKGARDSSEGTPAGAADHDGDHPIMGQMEGLKLG